MESWNLYNSIDMTRMLFDIRRSSGWIAEVFSNDSIMWVDYHNGDIRIHADHIINGGSLVSRVIDDINAKLDLYEELSKKSNKVWYLVFYIEGVFATMAKGPNEAIDNFKKLFGLDFGFISDVSPITKKDLIHLAGTQCVSSDIELNAESLKDENFAPNEFCL